MAQMFRYFIHADITLKSFDAKLGTRNVTYSGIFDTELELVNNESLNDVVPDFLKGSGYDRKDIEKFFVKNLSLLSRNTNLVQQLSALVKSAFEEAWTPSNPHAGWEYSEVFKTLNSLTKDIQL